jgi:hypothetical protein
MELVAFRPPPGVWRGIDTAGDDNAPRTPVIDVERAKDLHALGYRWVSRYTRPDGRVPANPVTGGGWQGCYELSVAESRWILDGGLGIWLNQFGIWRDVNGMHDAGKAASQCVRLLGAPAEVHHCMDIEGRGPASDKAKCKRRIEAWAAGRNAGGGRSALYYTRPALNRRELYQLRGVTCYWQAGVDEAPSVSTRGVTIEQDLPRLDYPDDELWYGDKYVAGVLCDTNTIRVDRLGDAPVLLATPEIAAAWYGEAMGNLAGSPFLTIA